MLGLGSRLPSSSPQSRRCRQRPRRRPLLVQLEPRNAPSVTMVAPAFLHAHVITPDGNGNGQPPYYPADISGAYLFREIQFRNPHTGQLVTGDGTGQTIAIVDAGDSPTLAQDLASFDAKFGLPAPPSFQKVNWAGQPAPLPPPIEDWPVEISLDVEWAHALAPKANIILFEAAAPTIGNVDDLGTAVQSAANSATYGPLGVPVAGVISNSYGGSEFSSEASLDYIYTTPDNHATFVASTGDSGAPGGWPAFSPDVLAAGGTSLYTKVNASGQTVYNYENGWSGSGGGVSVYEPKPSYQSGLSYTARSIPDVSMDSDPNTGLYMILAGQAFEIGGTSAAAPMWSALLADLNQGRALNGKGTLGNAQALVYGLPSTDFHDVTAGNNGFAAGPGYDLVTGIGSPYANRVVSGLLFASSGHVTTASIAPQPNAQGAKLNPLLVTVPLATVPSAPLAVSLGVSARSDGAVPHISQTVVIRPAPASLPPIVVGRHVPAPAAAPDGLMRIQPDQTTAADTDATAATLRVKDDFQAQQAELTVVPDHLFAAQEPLRISTVPLSAAAVAVRESADPLMVFGVGLILGIGLEPDRRNNPPLEWPELSAGRGSSD